MTDAKKIGVKPPRSTTNGLLDIGDPYKNKKFDLEEAKKRHRPVLGSTDEVNKFCEKYNSDQLAFLTSFLKNTGLSLLPTSKCTPGVFGTFCTYDARPLVDLRFYNGKDEISIEVPQIGRKPLPAAMGDSLCYISRGHRMSLTGSKYVLEGLKSIPEGEEIMYIIVNFEQRQAYQISDSLVQKVHDVFTPDNGVETDSGQYTDHTSCTVPWEFQHPSAFRPVYGENVIALIEGVEYLIPNGDYRVFVSLNGIYTREGELEKTDLTLMPGIYTVLDSHYMLSNKPVTMISSRKWINQIKGAFKVTDLVCVLGNHVFPCESKFGEQIVPCGGDVEHQAFAKTTSGYSVRCEEDFEEPPTEIDFGKFSYRRVFPHTILRHYLKNGVQLCWDVFRDNLVRFGGAIYGSSYIFGPGFKYTVVNIVRPYKMKNLFIGGPINDMPVETKLEEELREFAATPNADELGDVVSCVVLLTMKRLQCLSPWEAYTSILTDHFPETISKYLGRAQDLNFASQRVNVPQAVFDKPDFHYDRRIKEYSFGVDGLYRSIGIYSEMVVHSFTVIRYQQSLPDHQLNGNQNAICKYDGSLPREKFCTPRCKPRVDYPLRWIDKWANYLNPMIQGPIVRKSSRVLGWRFGCVILDDPDRPEGIVRFHFPKVKSEEHVIRGPHLFAQMYERVSSFFVKGTYRMSHSSEQGDPELVVHTKKRE